MDCGLDLFNSSAETVKQGILKGIAAAGLPKLERVFIAMGPIPAEESCKELVLWISNVRFFDSNAPDTLTENRLLSHYGVAFDINVRIGLCYVESDDDGGATSSKQLESWSKRINQYGLVAFTEGVKAIHQTNPPQCSVSITPRNMEPYNLGGHAGWSYQISVGVI